MTILLTGSTGRLGTELKKLRDYTYTPIHRAGEYDVTDRASLKAYVLDKEIDFVVHCAAYTSVELAEAQRERCYKVNVEGTRHLALLGIPMLAISTEYAVNPTNYYAKTKKEAENVKDYAYNVKFLRLSFKVRPFPYPRAFTDQYTSADYVDVIAKEVDRAIDLYEFLPGLTNIGTERKTIYDLARQTRDVEPMSRLEIKGVVLPVDTSLDITEWEKIKHDHPSSEARL